MSQAFINDLRMSLDTDAYIDIETMTRHYKTTVRDLNEDDEYVVIHTRKTVGDKTTATTLPIAEIVAVTLHA